MTNKSLIKKAEELAQYLTQEELLEYTETWEDFLFHAYQFSDPQKIDRCFNMVTLYEMALSMQGLDWSEEWKNRDIHVEGYWEPN